MKILMKNSVLIFIIQVLMAITNLIILFYISNYFGIKEYGDYFLIKRSADILALLFLIGLTISIPRNHAFYKKNKNGNVIKMLVLLLPIVTSVLLLLLNPIILPLLLGSLYNQYGLVALSLIISFIIFGVINSYQRAIENFRNYSIYSVINYIILPLIPLIFSNSFEEYLIIYSYSLLTCNFVVYIIFVVYFFSNGLLNDRVIFDVKKYFEVLKYGLLRLPGLVLSSFIFIFPIVILNHFNMDYEKGLMSQLVQLFPLIIMPINAVGTVILPKMSSLIANNQMRSISKLMPKYINRFLILVVSVSIVIYLLSDLYFRIINNNPLNEDYSYIKYLLFGLIPFSFYSLFKNPIDAASNEALSTRIVIFSYIGAIIIFGVLLILEIKVMTNIILSMAMLFILLGVFSYFYIYKLYGRDNNDL